MAYSFFLKGDSFDRNAWLGDVREIYFQGSGSAAYPLSGIGQQFADLEEDMADGEVWLHPANGIRGVTMRPDGAGISLSLPSASAQADFGLAWELIRLGQSHGASAITEEGEALDASDEQIASLTPQISGFLWSALIGQISNAESVTLPIGGRLHLEVPQRETPCDAATLEAELVERMGRYSNAYVANLMQATKDGQTQLLSVYSQIPTLIDSRTELISIASDNLPAGLPPVEAKTFYDFAKEEVEDLGPYRFVSEVSTFMLKAITAVNHLVVAKATSPGSPPPPILPAAATGLTGADWATMAKAPCLVFLIVAAADGSIDKKEITAFGKLLQQQKNFPAPIVAKFVDITRNNVEAMLTEMVENGVNPGVGILELMGLLTSGKISQEDATAVSTYLYGLGEAVASASGGFLGFGPKISKKEETVLKALKNLLGL